MAREERSHLTPAGPAAPRRTKVLHIITNLGIGGAERLVVSAARGLPPDRFKSAICCFTDRGPLAADAQAAGVPVFCVGAFPGFGRPDAFLRLLRIVRNYQPAIVHTHLQSPNLYGRLAAVLARVPCVVATEHNVYDAKPGRYVAVERLLLRSTDALVAVSEQVRRTLAGQLRIDPQRIYLVMNGVAPPTRTARATSLRDDVPASTLVIAVVASLTAKKGHEHLFRAVARLREQGVRCVVLVAGDGAERARLESLAASLRLGDDVRFLGNVANVGDVLAASDLFVLPSIVEGLPLALLESMFAGVPVVATAVGGVPEVIEHGSNGLLVPPGNPQALADAISELIRDTAKRSALAARARDTVDRRFSERAYLRSLEDVYDAVLRGTP